MKQVYIHLYVQVFTILFFYASHLNAQNINNLHLTFIGEHILDAKTTLKKTEVGGLSGIDFYNGKWLSICDGSEKNTRYYEFDLSFNDTAFTGLTTIDVSFFKNRKGVKLDHKKYDAESIRFLNDSIVIWSSEGIIRNAIPTEILKTNIHTQQTHKIKFHNPIFETTRHNKGFEALSIAFSKQGIWFATESPLTQDGESPTFTKNNAPIRICYYDFDKKTITKQYAYQLDKIALKPKQVNDPQINGLVALLHINKKQFLTLERSFTLGYGTQGNVVKLYLTTIKNNTTAIEHMASLKNKTITPLTKKLILNFETIKEQLTSKLIDNIEGMCFGPKLNNGKRTLIFVSDNNFNKYGNQITQFIAFETDVE